MRRFKLIVFLALLCSGACFSQNFLWDMLTDDNQPYENIFLSEVSDDTLYFNLDGRTHRVHIDSILYLKRAGRSYVIQGLLLGMAGGGLSGYLISKNNPDKPNFIYTTHRSFFRTVIGVVLGGVLGAAAGSGLSDDRYYNFSKRSTEQKKALLIKLIDDSIKRKNKNFKKTDK